MKTCQCFSFSRLALVMKRDWMENWKKNLYTFLGIFLAFLFVYFVCMADKGGSSNGFFKDLAGAFAGISSFLLVYFASEIMKNMRTKEQRFSYLMLPATPLEKFVSRALYVTVGMFVMILLASLLAEVARWAFMPFFDQVPDGLKVCLWPDAWGYIGETISPFQTKVHFIATEGISPDAWPREERSIFFEIMMGYWITLWGHSLYVLGGNYFGKYAFFKTIGVIILIAVLVSMGISHIDFHVGPGTFEWLDEFFRNNSHWLTESFVAGVVGFIFFCLTALNWWLSYKLFTRQQVIKPKFRLL